MLKKLFLTIFTLCMSFFCSGALAKCEPACKQGETCRFEQPNTYYCKSYENVSGSQGALESGASNSMAVQDMAYQIMQEQKNRRQWPLVLRSERVA